MNEVRTGAVTWMKLGNTISERSQLLKATCSMAAFI